MTKIYTRGARKSERGVSLLEALICVAITSLIAAALLPLTGAATIKSMHRAQNLVERTDRATAEEKFRAIMRRADILPQSVNAPMKAGGDEQSLSIVTNASMVQGCGGATSQRVNLTIIAQEQSSALQCQTESGTVTLLTWRGGKARFAYSADGDVWRPDLQSILPQLQTPGELNTISIFKAPLVAFVLESEDAPSSVIIERIGASGTVPAEASGEKTT